VASYPTHGNMTEGSAPELRSEIHTYVHGPPLVMEGHVTWGPGANRKRALLISANSM